MPAVFLSGAYAQCLAAGIKLSTSATIYSGAVDPSSVATSGAVGDVYISTSTKSMYQKQDSGSSTNWTIVASGAAITSLFGDVTASGPGAASATVAKIQGTTVSGTTGSGNVVFSTSPTLTTPALGTPTALVGTNISGTATGLTAGNVTTNANLTGPITSTGNATAVAAQTGTGSTFVMQASPTLTTPVIGAATGTSLSVSGQLTSTVTTGTAPLVVSSTTQVPNLYVARAVLADSATVNANLTGVITSVGNATSIASQTGTGTKFVVDTSPTLVTPNLGTPTTLVGTNISGTAASLTSGNVTTNANLTGPITSVGNATSIAAQTGTGNTFVMQGSPTLTTPNLGTPSTLVGTNISGTAASLTAGNVTTNANLTGDVTSVGNATTLTNAPVIAKVLTGYTSGAGTVAATDSILQAIQKLNGNDSTNANLTGPITSVGNATSVAAQTGTGTTFVMQATPTLTTPVIGAATGTSLSVSGSLTSTVATGTAPLVVSSTTRVSNLNAATAGNADTVTTNANLTGPITSVGNATAVTNLAITNAMIAASTIDLAAKVTGTLPLANGGTAVTSVTTSPTASSFAGWDANKNISANNTLEGYTTTATAAGTTTLVVGSTFQQYFTGTTTQTVVLPVTSTLVLGHSFCIINNSTGSVTVQSSGLNSIQVMAASTQLVVTCILTSGTGVASWSASYSALASSIAGIAPTQQRFTSGTSQTYTTPTGVQYIKVRMVGGGGGGSSGGIATPGNGGTGGNTLFGTSLLVANGGVGGIWNTGGAPSAGGTASVTSPAYGTALSGAPGNNGGYSGQTSMYPIGGAGAGTPFGSGGGVSLNTNIVAIAPNTGAGGAGGSAGTNVGSAGGVGGSAGGYVEAIIPTPSATYTYSVGAAGAAGASPGSGGYVGGAGAAGYIEVTEYYTNLAIGTSASVTANYIMAGPTSGAAAAPTFRALVGADLPSINTRYYASATSLSGALATISWTTKDFENGSSGAMASGVYTVPVAGVYQVNAFLAISGTFILNKVSIIEIQKNSTVVSRFKNYAGAAVTQLDVGISDLVSCALNDTIRIQVSNDGTSPVIVSSNFENWISITRV